MSKWKGKSRGGVTGYKIFIFILKKFGLQPAYFLLYFVAFYFLIFTNKKSIFYYFHKRQGYSKLKAIVKIYQSYYIFGQTLLDKIALLSGGKNHFFYTFDGEEYLKNMAKAPQGGLLISAHVGNWEMAGQLLNRLGKPVNVIMFDAEHEKIRKLLERVEEKKQMKIIIYKPDMSHIYKINQAIKRNELIAIHGDRFVQGSKTIEMEFLNAKAEFPVGPFYLASKYQLPVSFVFALKSSKSSYHFYATSAKTYPLTGSIQKRNEIIQQIVNDFIKELEKTVKKYPEQWFNYYDFWKN